MFTLDELLHITNGILYAKGNDSVIESVHFDSRQLTPNSLFIALTSGTADGHDFLSNAFQQGASCAIISKKIDISSFSGVNLILVDDTELAFQSIAKAYREQLDIQVIAVTGSSGKTSTKDVIAHVLGTKKQVFKTFKNLNNHLGLPLSILQIKPEHEVAVLELGMNHAGEIDLLASIAQPTISVITNIGDAHIEFFGTREKIADAKAELLPHTSKDGFVLLNRDNDLCDYLASKSPVKTYYYSVSNFGDIFTTFLKTIDRGMSFSVQLGDKTIEDLFIPLFGEHNVSNTLTALFIANALGFKEDEMKQALATLTISEMRFQVIDIQNEGVVINDAYNANPTSMKASISTFSKIFPSRKKVLILGDMFELGEDSYELHADIGFFLNDYTEYILYTLGEESKAISDQFLGDSSHFTNYEELTTQLKSYINSDHVLLFKGSRGMKLEKIINAL